MGDLIDRQAAIDSLNDEITVTGETNAIAVQDYIRRVNNRLHDLPSAQPEIIRCKDCRWWDKYNEKHGYCMAAKHGFMSSHWEISIYRTYDEDFFCADSERRTDG